MRKITDDEIASFDENGYVGCPNVIAADELAECRRESARLIDEIRCDGPAAQNVLKGPEGVPYYLTYLHANPNTFSLRLLAHPFVGDLLVRMVGADFIPLWESLVFKLPENGSLVPWHRDDRTPAGDERIFNIDIYFDRSTVGNGGLWVIPGSHRWDDARAAETIERGRRDFDLPGAVPAEVEPGDVLLHHVRVLHGSPVNRSGELRRVVYFDNRAIAWNERYGWFARSVLEKRCRLYQHALAERRRNPYASDDERLAYVPPSDMPILAPGEPVDLRAERVAP